MKYIVMAFLLRKTAVRRYCPGTIYNRISDIYWRLLRSMYQRRCSICGFHRAWCQCELRAISGSILIFVALLIVTWIGVL